jgi:hypothetical protein
MKSFQTFQDSLDSGCIISEYHQHQDNPNYTVHLKKADGTPLVFTNITFDHLKSALKTVSKEEGEIATSWKSKKGGISFEDCIAQGGQVKDYHKTSKGTFAVHIETDDGKRHSFSSVSQKLLSRVPNFTVEE